MPEANHLATGKTYEIRFSFSLDKNTLALLSPDSRGSTPRTQPKHNMTNITNSPDLPASVTDILEMAPSLGSAPTPSPAPVFEDAEEIGESNGPVTFVDGAVQVTTITYSPREEKILADLAIKPDDAALAGLSFNGDVPTPGPRSKGGMYQAPGLKDNLKSADRVFMTCTALEALAGNANGLACVALDGPFDGVPAGLMGLIRNRALVLLKHQGTTMANGSLMALEKELRMKAPAAVVIFGEFPEPETLKLEKRAHVTLCHWIRATSAAGVNSLFSNPIRLARAPTSAVGGFDACGFSGNKVVIFSRRRETIMTLSASDLKDEISLGMAIGVKHLQRNYTTVNSKTGQVTINAKALGMEIVEACEPLGEFDSNKVYGAGVWRNGAGYLVVNSRQVFTADGKEAKRIDGSDFYVSTRDLGISPGTQAATAHEAGEAFDLINNYNFKTPFGSMLVFGWTMDAYTCGANDGRPVLFQVGPPGSGKSTVLNIQRSLLGEACDHLVGTTEAYLRQMNGLNSLALLLDESEQREDNANEFNKIVNFARLSTMGGSVGRGAGDGGAAKKFTVRSAVAMVANRLPRLQPADVSRMLFVHYERINSKDHKHFDLMPNPRSLRFPKIEALGRKLFVRMLQSFERNARNKAVIERNIKTDSSRALMTLAPSIASAYTALHDDELDDAKAIAWLAEFQLADAVEEIESAQRDTKIIEFLASKRAPHQPVSEPRTIEMLWSEAYSGEERAKKAAQASLAVMGMRVYPGASRGTIQVRMFHRREGLKELFNKSEWEFANLGKALCEDSRTHVPSATGTCIADPRKAVGDDAERKTAERYVVLEWQLRSQMNDDASERIAAV